MTNKGNDGRYQFSIIKIDAIKDIITVDKIDESEQIPPIDHILLGNGPNVRYVDLEMIKKKECEFESTKTKKIYVPEGVSGLGVDIFKGLSKTYYFI